jgi:putative transposase
MNGKNSWVFCAFSACFFQVFAPQISILFCGKNEAFLQKTQPEMRRKGAEKVEKRYNFRIYPNAAQEAVIQKSFGCCRYVYNRCLAKRIEAYEKEHRLPGLNECCRDLTRLKAEEGMEWLAEADANALLVALKELDRAYRAFFRRVKKGGEAPGFPGFKSKRGRNAYTSRKKINRRNIEIEAKAIKLPKLGLVRCRVSRRPEGRILSATVFQEPSGKYFVSVCCTEVPRRPLPKTGKAVNLHLDLTDLVTTPGGERAENPRCFEKAEKKIARLSRGLSRKPKGSRNREKARIKLARAHERIANQRSDTLNKLSTRLVREYDVIRVRPAAGAQDGRLAKRAADAGLGGLLAGLRYKCDWYGKELILADARGASSAPGAAEIEIAPGIAAEPPAAAGASAKTNAAATSAGEKRRGGQKGRSVRPAS